MSVYLLEEEKRTSHINCSLLLYLLSTSTPQFLFWGYGFSVLLDSPDDTCPTRFLKICDFLLIIIMILISTKIKRKKITFSIDPRERVI